MTDDPTLPTGPHDHTTPVGPIGPGTPTEEIGAVIGPYRLVRRLGEGGMGEVFEAEQTEPIRRRVALKVIKQGMDTRAVVARFDAERQALALMDHPCIARVYDAGATDRGRPFFVMEYVEGEPITEWCNRRRLSTNERLELFVRVCEGVQHAHQKAIIHRDLKPTNILVAEVDGRPVPKIIDFGVAKATTQRLTEMTMFTEMGQLIGTPEYMSPEQATNTNDDIDTRTDVYALGVVLYELLSGSLPFESKELRKAGYDAIRRIICEQEPPRPSSRLSTLGDRATSIADDRGSGSKRLQSELRGDLDWITMKALEKDRERRYETANGLAADVRRHLHNEPVVAGPPSASYRLGKLVRRNRRTFAALSAVALVMVAATVISSVMYARAEQASRLARSEAAKSSEVSRFLSDMLSGVGPHVAQGRDTAMLRDILDKTAERVGRELGDQPEVEATLRLQLSDTYRQLGEYDAAQEQMDRAREIQSTVQLTPPLPVEIMVMAGSLAWNRGDLRGAEALFRETLDMMAAPALEDSVPWAEAALYLGNVLQEQGSYADAESLLHRSLPIYRGLPSESDGLAVNLNSLGNLARYRGDYPAAEAFYREALEVHRRVLGGDHPFVATDLTNLGRLLIEVGQVASGEEMMREALEIVRRVYSGPHPDVAMALRSLAELIAPSGRLEEAEVLARESLEMNRAIHGEHHESTVQAIISVSSIQSRSGAPAEAEATLVRLVESCRDPSVQNPDLLPTALYTLATTQARQGKLREAIPAYREAVELQTASAGTDHPRTLLFRNDYARALSSRGDDETAIGQLMLVLDARERVLGASNPATAITRVDLGRSFMALGRPEEAEAQMRRGRDDYANAQGSDHPGGWIATVNLANALSDLGRFDEAAKELRSAEAFYLDRSGPGHVDTRMVRARLSTVYTRAERRVEADSLLAEALDPTHGPVDARTRGRITLIRGQSARTAGDLTTAEKSLREAFAVFEADTGPTSGDAQFTARQLVKLYEQAGRPQDAARWRARVQ